MFMPSSTAPAAELGEFLKISGVGCEAFLSSVVILCYVLICYVLKNELHFPCHLLRGNSGNVCAEFVLLLV
jgi:hypothetical protein